MAEFVTCNKVDLLYVLNGSGWSTCIVFVDKVPYELMPTHIFGDPLDALLDGFTQMLGGADSNNILWHDEPGRFEWHIERLPEQHNLVAISISNCTPLAGPEFGTTRDIIFHTTLEVFATLILYQARKIRDLIKLERDPKSRHPFPHGEFDTFERAFKGKYQG